MRFCYINTANIYPRDIHLIEGLRRLGHDVMEINEKNRNLAKYKNIVKKYLATDRRFDAIIVGFTCPHFVPLARLITINPVIFNGGSSQYEANVVSRGDGANNPFIRTKWWLLDFISFHASTRILLESNAQIDYVNRLFFVPKKKMARSWIGVDDRQFYMDPKIKKRNGFTVLFRGRFLPESGVLTVIKSAKLLEKSDVKFLIMGAGFLHREVKSLTDALRPENIEIISTTLPIDELRRKMLECHVSLGQLADHPRLLRTLPCKLFESLALGLPYLTGRNKAAFELLTEDVTAIAVNSGDADDLAKKILFLRDNPAIIEKIGRAGRKLYEARLTPEVLAEEFIRTTLKQ